MRYKISNDYKRSLFDAGKGFCQRGTTDRTMQERKAIIDEYCRIKERSQFKQATSMFKAHNTVRPVNVIHNKMCEESLKLIPTTARRNAVTERSIEERMGLIFYLEIGLRTRTLQD